MPLSPSRIKSLVAAFAAAAALAVLGWAFHPALAQVSLGLEVVGGTGLGNQDLRLVVMNGVRILLGFLGLVAVLLLLYGGYLWTSSRGNEEQITKAKQVIRNAVIGLVIILSAFGLVSFIISQLQEAAGVGGGAAARQAEFFGTGLGNGIVESHYPGRNVSGIPRNTKLVITFRETMDDAGLISAGRLNSNGLKLRRASDSALTGPFVTAATVRTNDHQTYVVTLDQPIGDPSGDAEYAVSLQQLSTTSGRPAFGSGGSYTWRFTTSSIIDTEPPYVTGIVPSPGSEGNPRNSMVQVNFSEAVDPTTASGRTANGFANLIVAQSGGATVNGIFRIANQYQTVEYVTEDQCGQNSCGGDVFCLPASAALSLTVKTPVNGLNGVTDLAGNGLDGDRLASGLEDFTAGFATNDQIDLTPPTVLSVQPTGAAADPEEPVRAQFSKLMSATSLTPDSFSLVDVNGQPVASAYWLRQQDAEGKSTLIMDHEALPGPASYRPQLTSQLKDLRQNCYFPCAGPTVSSLTQSRLASGELFCQQRL